MASKSPSPEPPERYINDIRHGLGPSSHVGFLPLQDPDVLLSRSHLAGLLLARKASSDNFRHHAHSPTRPDRSVLDHPNMRYMRLIGNSNPRYEWEQYRKTPEELRKMKKPMFVCNCTIWNQHALTECDRREYYEKNNRLVEHYIYIDKLLDSTLPRDLLRTYHDEHEVLAAHSDP